MFITYFMFSNHTGKSKDFGEKSLFLDLLMHLRATIRSNMEEIQLTKINAGQFDSGVPYDQINLLQSSVMCVDTLVRALGKSSSWQTKVSYAST